MPTRQFFFVSVHRGSGGARAEVVLAANEVRIGTEATPGEITEAEIE